MWWVPDQLHGAVEAVRGPYLAEAPLLHPSLSGLVAAISGLCISSPSSYLCFESSKSGSSKRNKVIKLMDITDIQKVGTNSSHHTYNLGSR